MGAANGVDDGAAHEVRIFGAQENATSSLIGGVCSLDAATNGRAEQGGDVGVVHRVDRAVAVDFEGVDAAMGWVNKSSMRRNGFLKGRCQTTHAVCQGLLVCELGHDVRRC